MGVSQLPPHLRQSVNTTIASGASLSGATDLVGGKVVGVQMPAAWDAANLTFQGSLDNSTFQNVYDDGGTEVTVTAAAARAIGLSDAKAKALQGWRYVKVRSGTSGLAVNQTAERTVSLVCVAADG